MATLHEAHMACVRAVNTAPNEAIHRSAEDYLIAWRDGVAEALAWDDADRGAFLMAADNHYLDQPEHAERPMCGGVWLDWTPTENDTALTPTPTEP